MIVLFVSPHPDDIEIFCGGAFLSHYHQKQRLHVCMVTSGGMGTIRPSWRGEKMERLREQEACLRYAKLSDVVVAWLGWLDGAVRESEEKVAQVVALLQQITPELIYLPEIPPHTRYKHPDHLQTTVIFEKALICINSLSRRRYYHSKSCNTFVDVAPYIAENRQALMHYKSQASLWANPPYLLQLIMFWQNMIRCRQGKIYGCEQAEAFREL